jgi:hypothetical protein
MPTCPATRLFRRTAARGDVPGWRVGLPRRRKVRKMGFPPFSSRPLVPLVRCLAGASHLHQFFGAGGPVFWMSYANIFQV